MKQTQQFTGGMPAYIDDLKFSEDGAIEALQALGGLYADLDGNVILTGCQNISTQAGAFEFSPGWILLRGELLRYPGGQALSPQNPQASDVYEFFVQNTVIPGGTRQFVDGQSRNVWIDKVAGIRVAQPSAGQLLVNGRRAEHWVRELTQRLPVSSVPLLLNTGWVAVAGSNPHVERYADGQVRVRGRISLGQTNNLAFKIPLSIAPFTKQPDQQFTSISHGPMVLVNTIDLQNDIYTDFNLFVEPVGQSNQIQYTDALVLDGIFWYV